MIANVIEEEGKTLPAPNFEKDEPKTDATVRERKKRLMIRKRRSRAIVIGITMLVLVTALIWNTYRQVHRERMGQTLIDAIKHGNTGAAIAALNAGADPNTRDRPPTRTASGFLDRLLELLHVRRAYVDPISRPTALLVALQLCADDPRRWTPRHENDALIQALLDHGADPNARDFCGDTALQRAVCWGYTSTVRRLLDAGADPNATTIGCQLQGANFPTQVGYDEPEYYARIRNLGRYMSFISQIHDQHNTPLMLAFGNSNTAIGSLLLKHGAIINARNNFGETALICAAQYDDPNDVKFLLRFGADPNARTTDGITAWSMALTWQDLRKRSRSKAFWKGRDPDGYRKIVDLLKQAGAKK